MVYINITDKKKKTFCKLLIQHLKCLYNNRTKLVEWFILLCQNAPGRYFEGLGCCLITRTESLAMVPDQLAAEEREGNDWVEDSDASRKPSVGEIFKNRKDEQPWGWNTSCTSISGDQMPVGAHWANSHTVFSSKSAKSCTKNSICAPYSPQNIANFQAAHVWFCFLAGWDQPSRPKCQQVIASLADVSPVW